MMRATLMALRASPPLKRALLLLVVGGSIAVAMHARHTSPPPPPPEPVEPICVLEAEPAEPPPPNLPGPDVYALLDSCLRNARHPWGDVRVDVSQVRYWVEVEHDPAWFESGSWWLPLSGEGEADSPSGIYISVPLSGASCGGALVN
jgi:hypothetical protein